jgi:RNA polymerase sigma factor (sigma-70 family)
MATNPMGEVLEHLRRAAYPGGANDRTDAQLLEAFVAHRDEAAFAALMRRHGPLVWGVCRRVLRDHQDAEDAFQATFLVLARKASSIASRNLLANWLYGVAFNSARKARALALRRQVRERSLAEPPELPAAASEPAHDLSPVLDRALQSLPDRYRVPIVLCDVEGKTHRVAARQVGCPPGTLSARLARGRALLARRLARQGFAVSGAMPASVWSSKIVLASEPTRLVASTVEAALLVARGQAATPGAISARVAAIVEGVLQSMSPSNLRITFAVVLLGVALLGGTLAWCAHATPTPVRAGAKGPAAPAGRDFVVVGRVLDETGKHALEGVRVTVHTGNGTLFKTGEGVTDKDGRFRLVFAPKLWGAGGKVLQQAAIVWAQKPGFYCWNYGWPAEYVLTETPLPEGTQGNRRVANLCPGQEARIEFRMAPAAALRVRLVDGAGKPMAGTRIWLTGDSLPPGSSVLWAGETDADGLFVAKDVRHGRFRLVIADRERHELELGSIQFADPVEYVAEATIHAWTPGTTHTSFSVTRGRAPSP